jgi:hypothetical protein
MSEGKAFTFQVDVRGLGPYYVPDVFKEDLTRLLAGLDFARVGESTQTYAGTELELSYAAKHAAALARRCEHLAGVAVKRQKK